MTRLALADIASTVTKTNGNGHAPALRPPYELDALPTEIREHGRFVLQGEDGKPYEPRAPWKLAAWSKPETLSDFDLARAAFNTNPGKFRALQFVCTPELTAVDLDDCLDAEGRISPGAKAVLEALPDSRWEKSPGGHGLHGYFRSAPGAIKAITKDKGRTHEGQPVEVYASGHLMSVTGWTTNDAPLGELKAEHVEPYRVKKATKTLPTSGHPILEGERNSALLSLAGAMRRQGASTDAIAMTLLQTNGERCRPPLDDKRIGKLLSSIAKYDTGDLLAQKLTDAGNAERLLHHGEGDYAYIAAFDRWVVWDGTRWPVDDKEQQHIRAQAHDMAHLFIMQAASALKDDSPATKEVLKFATGCLNTSRLNNMLREAQPHAIRKVEELDRDPLLVNFLNGTFDARTGKLREHRREDGITKIIPFDYDADARCPKWEAFLTTTFDESKDLVKFFQRAVGYSLTGLTLEKCLFLVQGPTDTAKTTTMKIIGDLAGDYAGCIRVESLMAERGRAMDNNAKDDLADLRGTRLVRTSETAEGQRLREELVKELTQGQGKFKAVRKFESHFEFPETWKIWMDCNHQPIVRGTDDAIWNRLIVIPFSHQVAKADINPRLGAELISEEAEGILAWMVRGLAAWRAEGLKLPKIMADQREEWRKASDDLGQFLDVCATTTKGAKVHSTRLYDAYTQWRSENGYSWVESTVVFARKMKERGFTKEEKGDKKIPTWLGLQLTPVGELSAQQGAERRGQRMAKAANG